MNLEQQVKEALRSRAGQPGAADDAVLAGVTAAGDRRRRRKAVAALGGGLVALVLLAVLAVGAVTDDGGRLLDVQPPATEPEAPPTTGAAPTTATTRTDRGPAATSPASRETATAARPEAAVAVRDDATTSRLVRIATDDGSETTLLERTRESERDSIGGVSVARDGTVWFADRADSCAPGGRILRVPAGGGEPEAVLEGYAPSVSPDGRWLAYAELAPDREPDVHCATTMVVRDLTSGAERRWTQDLHAPDGSIAVVDSVSAIAWHPSEQLVAVELTFEGTGVQIVDVSAPGGDLQAGRPVRPAERSSYAHPAFVDDVRLAVWEVCCAVEDDLGFDDTSRRVAFVDPATGEEVGGFDPPFDVVDLDYDRSGTHLLYVTAGGDLFAGWGDEAPRRLAGGVTDAAW